MTDYADLDTYLHRGPLPAWVREIRPHQATAIAEIMDAYEAGADLVFLDAPTGTGKTLIGELVRRLLGKRGVYVCSDRSLQRQFVRDFPYAKLLEGKGNYATEHGPADKTCDDCTSMGPADPCDWCAGPGTCPYQVAKREALGAPLAVLNTSYLLASANFAGTFNDEEFTIIDEADALEDTLLGFVEYKVPRWLLKRVSEPPKKGAHKQTIIAWMDKVAEQVAADARLAIGALDPKTIRSMHSFAEQTRSVARAIAKDVEAGDDGEDGGKWLRVYESDDPGLHLKPVLVGTFGSRNLWRHAERWLLMSATLISTDEMIDTLGIPLDTATVTVPMTFPVENRPIILAPIADMSFKAGWDAYLDMAYAIQRVCDLHEGERVLVHTVSRDRADKLIRAIREIGGLGRRPIVDYRSARERDMALRRYLDKPGSVLFAQSMSRGIDLPGDACRVQIIAKVPFPSLGDRRVSARLHLPGGEQWYRVQAIRDVVQMTGRGVRSATDHATTYIFDSQFTRNLWKPPTRSLFPGWWREAVDKGADVRVFIRARSTAA